MRQIAGRLLVATMQEQEARQEAEAANRAKDEFLAMVSHDLRTPLTAILGWCAMLSGWHDGPAIEHGLQVIQQNANAQLKLVEDLLDATRLASSRLSLTREMIDLADIVRRAVDTVRPIADRHHIAVTVHMGDARLPVLGDANRLGQVFLNVMMNAVKFTDPGGSVDVSSRTADGTQQIIIRDNGRGIPASLLPCVFERFRQGTIVPADLHGLGLGLAIARDIIELHGGTIHIDSPGDGQGTTCTISLPLHGASSPSGEYAGAATALAGMPKM
jgi:signal transduction histidine kinase